MSDTVIVIGGGVVGLTTAVVLAERGRREQRVRVWSRDPAEGTTSAVAGALFWPYRIEPAELVDAWSLRSLREYVALARDPEVTGVRMVAGVLTGTALAGLGSWSRELPELREARAEELPAGAGQGLRGRVPLVDMPAHLRYLERRLRAAGGSVERRTVGALAEAAAEANVVVNCSGLGARELVPDASVHPVRGQLVIVENPGIEEWLVRRSSSTARTAGLRRARDAWSSARRSSGWQRPRWTVPTSRARTRSGEGSWAAKSEAARTARTQGMPSPRRVGGQRRVGWTRTYERARSWRPAATRTSARSVRAPRTPKMARTASPVSTAVLPDITGAEAPRAANRTAASSCCQTSGLPVCIRTTPGSSRCQGPPGAQRRAAVPAASP
ncbi:FAD-dependent oxidoreductase [Streptomyces niveus]|uniref:FAD-dependent oxidoreductase n=1 Tax=Streptomyces niveus TaxID=193462 RepID=UPI003416D750